MTTDKIFGYVVVYLVVITFLFIGSKTLQNDSPSCNMDKIRLGDEIYINGKTYFVKNVEISSFGTFFLSAWETKQ